MGMAVGAGCSEAGEGMDDKVAANSPVSAQELMGIWTTTNVDEDLGEISVLMTLEKEGSLSMVEIMAAGGQLSFPGTWEQEGDHLILRGVYFKPAGEARVKFSIRDGDTLMLEDATGKIEEWKRM